MLHGNEDLKQGDGTVVKDVSKALAWEKIHQVMLWSKSRGGSKCKDPK